MNNTLLKMDIVQREQIKMGNPSTQTFYRISKNVSKNEQQSLTLTAEDLPVVYQFIQKQVEKINTRKEVRNEKS